MRFWDSSAIVPLLLQQPASPSVRNLFAADPDLVLWTLSDVEVHSAFCRLLRDKAIDAAVFDAALAEFRRASAGARIVSAVDATKERAKRLPSTLQPEEPDFGG